MIEQTKLGFLHKHWHVYGLYTYPCRADFLEKMGEFKITDLRISTTWDLCDLSELSADDLEDCLHQADQMAIGAWLD